MGSIHDDANHDLDGGPASELRGDPAAQRLRWIVEHEFDFIWRSARRLTASSADVDGATLKTFQIAARQLDRVLPNSERTYLFATAACVVSDFRRARGRDGEGADVADRWLADAMTGRPGSGDPRLNSTRARVLLDRVLGVLPIDLRVVLVLAEGERMSMPEIGELLGLGEAKVAARHRRALSAFRERVGAWSYPERSEDEDDRTSGAAVGRLGGPIGFLRKVLNKDPVAALAIELLDSMAQDEPPQHARENALGTLGLSQSAAPTVPHAEVDATCNETSGDHRCEGTGRAGERDVGDGDEGQAGKDLRDVEGADWAPDLRAADALHDWPSLRAIKQAHGPLSASILRELEHSETWVDELGDGPEGDLDHAGAEEWERELGGAEAEEWERELGSAEAEEWERELGGAEADESGSAVGGMVDGMHAERAPGHGLSTAPGPTAVSIPPATRLLQSYGPMLFRPFLIGSLAAAIGVVALKWPRAQRAAPGTPSSVMSASTVAFVANRSTMPAFAVPQTARDPAPVALRQSVKENRTEPAVAPSAERSSMGAASAKVVAPSSSSVSPGASASAAPSVAFYAPSSDESPAGELRPPPTRHDLDRETRELAAIRGLVAAGTPDEVRQALDYYEDEFPAGLYRVEVLALRIELLMKAGDREGARKLVDAFEASNPRSGQLPRIRALLGP